MSQSQAPPQPEVTKRPGFLRRAARRIFPTRAELRRHRWPLLLCLVSGLFGGLIFHHNALGLLGWVALAPYFVAIHHLRGRMLAWGTMLFGFTWYYLGLFWLHALIVFSLLIPLGVLVGVIYISLYFLLFSFPAAWCTRNLSPALRPWAIAVCWTAVEFLRNFTDMAFPWNLLGHSQAPVNTLHMDMASVGGVYLVSFLMALCNAAMASLAIDMRNPGFPSRVRLRPVLLPLAIIGIVTIAITGVRVGAITKHVRPPLNVSVIQPGISQLEKWDALMGRPDDTAETYRARHQAMDTLMQESAGNLIREAARQDQPELMVMPESVFLSQYFPYDVGLHQQLEQMSREVGSDFFFGADNRIDREMYDKLAMEGQRFLMRGDEVSTSALPRLPVLTLDDGTTVPNFPEEPPVAMTVAAWHVSRDQGLEPRVYNKMQLVPFGEMVPFISGIDWLREALEAGGIAGSFKPGLQNTIFESGGATFGAVICFESTFSHLTRHLANAGADFIAVLTNDAWYDPEYAISEGGFWGTLFRIPGINQLASAGPMQHFIHSQFRAIETGLPVVRSANSGISAIVASDGTVTEELGYSRAGFITGKVPVNLNGGNTLSVRWGEWVGLICTGLWLALVVGVFLSGGKHTRQK